MYQVHQQINKEVQHPEGSTISSPWKKGSTNSHRIGYQGCREEIIIQDINKG
jgi:hypothetical protein